MVSLCFLKPSIYLSRRTFFTSRINYSPRSIFSDDSYRLRTFLNYTMSFGIFMIGFGYGTVPLYRLYCTKTGSGTNANFAKAKTEKIRSMKPVKDYELVVYFAADTYSKMAWKFKPLQKELTVVPGETALAFYSAENPTDKPIVGIATYSIVPFEASKYFNKIQCFCFEEQRLNPHEKVDLPVFFYIDPEITSDPRLKSLDMIILNYTFFEAKKSKLYVPGITTPEYADVETPTPTTDDSTNCRRFCSVMSSTLGSGTRYHRVSEIKECENQAKFVNQRINEIEAFFGDLCSELVNYTRRTAKLRNNGDEISRIILDYSLKEKISRTTSEALHKVSEYLATVEDYRHTEVDRIVGKVVNPLAAYGEEIKHVRVSS
uniref:Cytochrome c oxidase assembly protein COX11, mitochondrial n=1 Tax=Trichobilharzia regenti TaxID=157069 RepID=A0AA85J4I7_TRIRE|nr:unnamed protein product [Trichobilharzia regenti]